MTDQPPTAPTSSTYRSDGPSILDPLTQVTVYGGPSNRGGRALWALEELGIAYEVKNLALFSGEQRSPEFLAINPRGKVPTLTIAHPGHDTEIITESLAILYVLAQRYGQDRLWPIELHAQARCHQWLAFGATELEPPVWIHAKHSFIYPKKRRISDIFPSCMYDYKRAVFSLEDALSDERQWICGDRFYVADLLIAHTLMWGEQRQLGELPKYTCAYLSRAKARPAWSRVYDVESSPTPR